MFLKLMIFFYEQNKYYLVHSHNVWFKVYYNCNSSIVISAVCM